MRTRASALGAMPQAQGRRPLSGAAAFASSPAFWGLLATAVLVGLELAANPGLQTIGDPDDATRLIQVREFLAGAGWYDTMLPRIGGPTPLQSHWSRLIDVPIAGLILFFGAVTPWWPAEVAARIAWPALLTFGLLLLLAEEAKRRTGLIAAGLVIVLAATTLTGQMQFRAGRIDHHNAMIFATLAGLLRLTRPALHPGSAAIAGAAFGLALTIGYEPLALIVPVLGVIAVIAAFVPAYSRTACAVAVGFSATLVLGLIAATPPSLWHLVACDALAINLVVAAAAGAVGLAILAGPALAAAVPARLAILAVTGAAAVALYLAADPTCIGGPFARVSAEAKQMWLSQVHETRAIVATIAALPIVGLTFLVSVVLGCAAAWSRARSIGSVEAKALAVLVTAATLPALLQAKFMPYASFLAAFALALAIAESGPIAGLSAPFARILKAALSTQYALAIAVMPLAAAIPEAPEQGLASGPCKTTSSLEALGRLPRGLLVVHQDVGPFAVLTTHHDVLSAPYHRIDRAIVDGERVLRGNPEAAAVALRRLGATYIGVCVGDGRAQLADDSFENRLARGERFDFLSDAVSAGPLRVWRVR